MCPSCFASVAMMIASVMSTGGLTAVAMKKFSARSRAAKELIGNQNPKEETWEK